MGKKERTNEKEGKEKKIGVKGRRKGGGRGGRKRDENGKRRGTIYETRKREGG